MNPDVYIKKLFDEKNIEDGLYDSCDLYLGFRGPPDLQKSLASFETAASQGHKSAKYILSLMYAYGKGTVESGEQSARWLKKAVKSGSPDAEFDLGFCYYIGKNIASELIDSYNKNKDKAKIIANQSIIEKTYVMSETSMFDNLSELSYDTLLVHPLTIVSINEKQNKSKAFQLFRLAGNSGHAVALQFVADMLYTGDSVGIDIKEATRIYELSALNGNHKARYRLALMYFAGKGVPKDHKKALELILPVAESGHINSQNLLGSIYRLGDDSVKNYKEAVKWYTISANAGNAMSMYQLSICYFDGTGVEKDLDVGARYLLMSAEKKYPEALYLLGNWYFNGAYVELSKERAVEYYQYAADLNFPPAIHTLGCMYLVGDTVPKNKEKGLELLNRSLKMGYKESLNWINKANLH